MRTSAIFLSVLLALGSAGCADVFAPGMPRVHVMTDQAAYTAQYIDGEGAWERYGFDVVLRTVNRSSRTVYLDRCGAGDVPIYGVEQVGGGAGHDARSAYSPVWACPGSTPITLGPGESRTDSLHIQGPTGVDGITGEVMGSFEGAKRLSLSVSRCSVQGPCEHGEYFVRSQVFTVITSRDS
jgi:hypothetical protein